MIFKEEKNNERDVLIDLFSRVARKQELEQRSCVFEKLLFPLEICSKISWTRKKQLFADILQNQCS